MDTMEENWLPVVGYEGYEVSDLGRVKSIPRNGTKGGLLKLSLGVKDDRYCFTTLYKDNKRHRLLVHRVVLLTFLPINEIKEVNHKNHITRDNRLCNLEWCSSSENKRYVRKKKNCSSKYKGVYWNKNKKWEVNCRLDGKKVYLGCFDDEREAAKAYNDFVIKHNLQDFAILNDLNLQAV
jgi:hypothetical protein